MSKKQDEACFEGWQKEGNQMCEVAASSVDKL